MDERLRSALLDARECIRLALESMGDAGPPADEDDYEQRRLKRAAELIDWTVTEAGRAA